MSSLAGVSQDRYFGLFVREQQDNGRARLSKRADAPAAIPDPVSGRLLRIATIEAQSPAICPSCSTHADGGFISFHADLRLAYACPGCEELVWLKGA
jgi:hypothetical protein